MQNKRNKWKVHIWASNYSKAQLGQEHKTMQVSRNLLRFLLDKWKEALLGCNDMIGRRGNPSENRRPERTRPLRRRFDASGYLLRHPGRCGTKPPPPNSHAPARPPPSSPPGIVLIEANQILEEEKGKSGSPAPSITYKGNNKNWKTPPSYSHGILTTKPI